MPSIPCFMFTFLLKILKGAATSDRVRLSLFCRYKNINLRREDRCTAITPLGDLILGRNDYYTAAGVSEPSSLIGSRKALGQDQLKVGVIAKSNFE